MDESIAERNRRKVIRRNSYIRAQPRYLQEKRATGRMTMKFKNNNNNDPANGMKRFFSSVLFLIINAVIAAKPTGPAVR